MASINYVHVICVLKKVFKGIYSNLMMLKSGQNDVGNTAPACVVAKLILLLN